MDPLRVSLMILAGCGGVAFVSGLVTRNYSTVDRLWSVLPPVFALVWLPAFRHNPRYLIAAALVVAWGLRLTANFAIKGGYSFSLRRGFYEEDYRWPVLKQKIPNRVAFELFNLLFISGFQLALIFAFTLPLYFLGGVTTPLGRADYLLFGLMAALLALETTADLQQLAYYRKRGRLEYRDDPRVQLGFNTYGLWRCSRHPNYVCELGQWLVLYLVLYASTGRHHPSGLGAAVLVLLFVGSTLMAESITGAKCPAYARWRRATPMWLPFDLYLGRLRARREFWASLRPAALSPDGRHAKEGAAAEHRLSHQED
jgi:steroid 5-alpha reductase family enzyme